MPKKPRLRDLERDDSVVAEPPASIEHDDRDLERGEGGDFPASPDPDDLSRDD